MHGFFDTVEPNIPSPYRRCRCCLRPQAQSRLSRQATFRCSVALPIRTPVNASPAASRRPAHDSGREWWLTSTPCRTLTGYPLPVSLAHAHMVAKPPKAARCTGVLQPKSLPPSTAPIATGWSDSCRAGLETR